MNNYQRPSFPALTSHCYQLGYPEECQQSLQSLYLILLAQCQTISNNDDNITLVALFKLLKSWQFEMPFSLLATLFLQANRHAHQNLKQEINETSFHQLMHNPTLQQIYRKKPIIQIPYANKPHTLPQTLFSLFSRLGELVQRKILQTRINDESTSIRDKFQFMLQMMNTGERQEELFPTNPYKNETILFEDQEQCSILEKNKESVAQQQKFINIKSEEKFVMNTRLRRLHANMMKQMQILKSQDLNVKKVNHLIQKTSGNFFIKLPEI